MIKLLIENSKEEQMFTNEFKYAYNISLTHLENISNDLRKKQP